MFTDGHDMVAAELLWKAADEKDWTRVPCEALGNDRWKAAFSPRRIGRHLFTIEGWRDDYASLCHEIEVKHKAGVGIALELTEARHYLEQVLSKAAPESTAALSAAIKALESDDVEAAVHALTAPETVAAVAASAERAFVVQHAADQRRGRAAAGRVRELVRAVPALADRRPGPARHVRRRDRAPARHPPDGLRRPLFPADPSDRHEAPQGPQQCAERRRRAISAAPTRSAAAEGGHDAIHPQLGTLDDFRRLVAAAREQGLEIALDYRDPVLARPSVAARPSRLVPLAPGRHHQIRREPAEEVPGHRQCRFLRRRSARAVDRAARHRAVLGRRGRAHLPRRQSAHQAAAVLAMDDRRRARRAIPT